MNRARPRYSSKPHNVTMNGCSPRRVISHPWIAPRSAPSASMITTAAGQATCHSVSMIDSSTPSRANADPTDRSMPPVMITRPSPRLKIPNAPISRAVFWRFAADTKRGLSAVTMAHNTTSSRNVASSFFTSRRFYRCLGLGVLAACGAPDVLPIVVESSRERAALVERDKARAARLFLRPDMIRGADVHPSRAAPRTRAGASRRRAAAGNRRVLTFQRLGGGETASPHGRRASVWSIQTRVHGFRHPVGMS